MIRLYGDVSPELARYDRLAAEGFLDKARRCEIMPYRINGAIATPNYWPDILGVNPQTRPFNEALWQLAHEGMQEIARMGEQHGVPVFIAGLPPAYSADPAALSEAARLGTALPPELLTDTAVSDRFLEFCSRAAIHCASYLGPIREAMAHADADLYFPMDAHMSPRGNEVLGTLIAHDVAPFLRH